MVTQFGQEDKKSDTHSTPVVSNTIKTPTKSHERVTLRGRAKIFKGEKREYQPSPSSGDEVASKPDVMGVQKKAPKTRDDTPTKAANRARKQLQLFELENSPRISPNLK